MTHRKLVISIKKSEKYINTRPSELDISHFDMSTSTIEFFPGRKKGSRNVLYDGHLYHLIRKKNERTYWKCNKCKSRLTLVHDTFLTAKWVKFDEDIQRIVDDYDNYGDVTEFLTCYWFQNFVLM